MAAPVMLFRHDPNAVLDYSRDWSEWLADGETITTSTWVVPVGLTQGVTDNTGTLTTVWLSGGTAGMSYRVTNRVVTTGGRTDERSFTILCEER